MNLIKLYELFEVILARKTFFNVLSLRNEYFSLLLPKYVSIFSLSRDLDYTSIFLIICRSGDCER